jgi:hypothetical protein
LVAPKFSRKVRALADGRVRSSGEVSIVFTLQSQQACRARRRRPVWCSVPPSIKLTPVSISINFLVGKHIDERTSGTTLVGCERARL